MHHDTPCVILLAPEARIHNAGSNADLWVIERCAVQTVVVEEGWRIVTEQYMWVPWDIDPSGTRIWPADFNLIQQPDYVIRSYRLIQSLREQNRLIPILGCNRPIHETRPPESVIESNHD